MKVHAGFILVAVCFVLVVAAVCASASDLLPRQLPAEVRVPQRVRHVFTRVIRPHVEMRQATTAEVLAYLQSFHSGGVRVVTHVPAESRQVIFEAAIIPQSQLVDRLCVATDLFWRYTSDGIEIGPRASFPP